MDENVRKQEERPTRLVDLHRHQGVESDTLARLGAAAKALAGANTIDEVKQVRDMAEAARIYARAAGMGLEIQNDAAEIKVLAERKAGEILVGMRATGELRAGQPGKGKNGDTLSQLEISRQQSSRWQKVAAVPERTLIAYVRTTRERGEEISTARLLRIARDEESSSRADDKATRAIAATKRPQPVDLRVGDFRSVLANVPDGSVDAIITDPPYPRKFLHLFSDLAEFADRVLTPDGVLAVMSGQTHLPDVFAAMRGHRPYRWAMAYMTPVHGYSSYARRVQSNWKPVLVFGGGPRFTDVITSAPPDKRLHAWGQDLGGFAELVERLTEPEAVVCDPLMGAGTTALAAASLGRRFIGCDVDSDAVAAAESRLRATG